MSAALDISDDDEGFGTLARKYAWKVTVNYVDHENRETIAQTPKAMAALREVLGEPIRAGGNGYVFPASDGSAIVTTNVWPDKVWAKWVV